MNATWNSLSPAARGAVIGLGALDASLRIAALVDLARRPADEVRGPKAAWAAALVTVNSAGALPLIYALWGRTPSRESR